MEHKAASFEVPKLERTLAKKKKRYVNYKEGMALYSMGRDSFRKLAKDAHALLRIKRWRLLIWTFWTIIWNSIAATTESEYSYIAHFPSEGALFFYPETVKGGFHMKKHSQLKIRGHTK